MTLEKVWEGGLGTECSYDTDRVKIPARLPNFPNVQPLSQALRFFIHQHQMKEFKQCFLKVGVYTLQSAGTDCTVLYWEKY